MKFSKKAAALSMAAVMSLSVGATAFAGTAQQAGESVNVQMNGKIATDKAVLLGGTTYIDASDVKGIFGADCKVDGGYATLSVDGKDLKIAIKTTGESLVSVRDIADALGCMLGWDGAEKTVVVVDIDRMADEKGATFDIIGKYFDYSKSIGESYKTIGDFSGSVEIADETIPIAIKFDGKMDAVSSDKCEEANVKLNMDLSDIKKQAGVEEMEASDKEIFETIMKALESSDTKVIYNIEAGIMYMKSTMFTVFGIDENTWISFDLNSFMEAAGASGFDMTSILNLVSEGDLKAYILTALKTIPVNTVSSYDEMSKAYDMIVSMLGDSAFTLENGKYKSNFAMNEDGAEITYVMTMGTDGNKVNSCEITMKMSADGMVMDMYVSSDKNFNSSMTFSMNAADMMKIYMEMKSSCEATKQVPSLTVPAGATVISMNDMFASMISAPVEAA